MQWIDREAIFDIVMNIISSHKFPDGCLDLGRDEQEIFAQDITDMIITYLHSKSAELVDEPYFERDYP